jgi:DNA-binding response OmpR family regulator
MSLRPSIRRTPRIVIIDAYDECDMYAEAFRAAGYAVSISCTASNGLDLVIHDPPDAVIHGVRLPDMHGAELARRVRAAVSQPIRVIAITGFTDKSTLQWLQDAGCDAIPWKPCLPDDVIAQVRVLLQRSGRRHDHEPHRRGRPAHAR